MYWFSTILLFYYWLIVNIIMIDILDDCKIIGSIQY